MSTKRLTVSAIFIAMALLLAWLESTLPPLFAGMAGAKMGLSNVIALVALVILGASNAFVIQLMRCLLGGIITGGVFGLAFSIPAGLLSLGVMALLYRFVFPKISLMGISFAGAVTHNLVQVGVACILVSDIHIVGMLPFYLLASAAAGLFVGIVAYFIIKYLPENLYSDLIPSDKPAVIKDSDDKKQ